MTSTAVLLSLTVAVAWAPCDRPAPTPTGFHARGFGRVAEVFPPGSRHNRTESPVVYVYAVAPSGPSWNVDARLAWRASLPHRRSPDAVLVSPRGQVVVLDEDHDYDGTLALVAYDESGRRVAGHPLGDLFTDEEISAFEWSDCGVHWRAGARYFFLLEGTPRFVVLLGDGSALSVDLSDGTTARGRADDVRGLPAVLAKRFANEQVEVWATSLRFSSITDLLEGG